MIGTAVQSMLIGSMATAVTFRAGLNCRIHILSAAYALLQVVTFLYENGCTATVTMVATTDAICQRVTNIFGSKGEITCNDTEKIVFKYEIME